MVTTGPTASGVGAISGSYANQNVTDLLWGTRTLFGTYVVENIEENVDGENRPIANGDGVKVGRVLLLHGWTHRITVRDSTAIPHYQFGDRATCYDFGLLMKGNTNRNLVMLCRVVDSGSSASAGDYGRRTYTVEKLNAFVEPV